MKTTARFLLSIICFLLLARCQDAGADRDAHLTANEERALAVPSASAHANWPTRFKWAKQADSAFITKVDIDISPDGKGLPAGSGDAITGRLVYQLKCAACHGIEHPVPGTSLPAPRLITYPDSPKVKTIGNYWPYATTIFDYVRRSMPYNAPGSLTPGELYGVTAYLLAANKIIDSNQVMNRLTLPAVSMPAKHMFIADDRKGGPDIK